ncbi:ComEA family DNA-binding protein [Derxia lacustris]|uniref:ComEA family DNA-binding protein n=1 Tax=Derxia lacustris TaxID=764842 RepID=UPI000A16E378|nr:helix-hairpin-helix domain-containing protein [Derxia lacustris]
MTDLLSVPTLSDRSCAARFAGNRGYRLAGDFVCLNAGLDWAADAPEDLAYALQLRARPLGAALETSVKVAELRFVGGRPSQIEGWTVALPPAGNGEWTLELALCAGTPGQYETLLDRAEFDQTQVFLQPRLAGAVGYRFGSDAGFAGTRVVLGVDAIANPRAEGNLSGDLALELWALDHRYDGGAFSGILVAGTPVDRLAGGEWRHDLRAECQAAPLPAGEWRLVLMLREWTPAGLLTRDYVEFAASHVVTAEYFGAPEHDGVAAGTGMADAATLAEAQAPEAAVAVTEPVAAVEVPAAAVEPVAAIEAPVAEEAAAPAARSKAADAADKAAAIAKAATDAVAAVAPKAASAVAAPAAPTASVAPVAKAPATPAKPAKAGKPAKAPKAEAAPDLTLVSVNNGTESQLLAVKGLSKPIAKAIIAGRPYHTIEALLDVKGIGQKLLDKLRPSIRL